MNLLQLIVRIRKNKFVISEIDIECSRKSFLIFEDSTCSYKHVSYKKRIVDTLPTHYCGVQKYTKYSSKKMFTQKQKLDL